MEMLLDLTGACNGFFDKTRGILGLWRRDDEEMERTVEVTF
jgi:hypothetical protein